MNFGDEVRHNKILNSNMLWISLVVDGLVDLLKKSELDWNILKGD